MKEREKSMECMVSVFGEVEVLGQSLQLKLGELKYYATTPCLNK